MNTRFFLILLLLLPLKLAHATNYYVDSSFGNDNWSGNQSSPVGSPATDGPWQSLAKVSAQSLVPGDSVLLKCGGIWNETLTLKSSGTTTSPITIGAYPNACANKPIISGALPIPAHNWIREAGNIYKLSSVVDLIRDGTFENGLGDWKQWSPKNNASMALNTTSCVQANNTCMSFTSGSENSLAISNNFMLQGQQAYTATYTLKAPAGVSVWVILRRGAAPWDTVGLAQSVTGTGAWQTITLPFTATASLANARLDFVVPAGRTIGLDNVKITSAISNVTSVFDSGKSINVAHHPNRGYDSLKPDSLYYVIADNADQISLSNGSTGSSYVTTGLDLTNSAHPSLTAGTGIRIRTNAWTLNDRKIASVSGSHLYLDSPTTHPVKKDWGYFLYGQRWMLDEPGEWHYDPVTKTVAVWMADSAAPGSRVSIEQRAVGINADNLSNIRIDGLTIQNVDTGVQMQKATNIVLRNLNIFDVRSLGVNAMGSIDSGIENSQIIRSAGHAIYAGDFGGTRFHAYDNLITDSGVSLSNGKITSLPTYSGPALASGQDAVIRGNRIYGTSQVGILPLGGSLISGNHIENVCLVMDDCGAIYMGGKDNPGIVVENNTIKGVVGGLSGKPINIPTQSQGIYLDELLNGAVIRSNTVTDADNGIQIHNAANNLVENNTLYGNRRHHIWLQEGSKHLDSEGDIHDNQIRNNQLFLTTATPAVKQETLLAKTNTDRFADYDGNRYFTFLWPTMSSEFWPTGSKNYTLTKWKSALTSTNLPRNLDPAATEVNSAMLGYAAFRILSGNLVPNGNLSAGKQGWSAYNETAPAGQLTLASCTLVGSCLNYIAGGSLSLVNSPNFSVKQGQWYKVTFDLKAGINGQMIYVVTRRGGGGTNGYEWLMSAPFTFTATTDWQRYSFLYQATKTINAGDPVTQDLGARIDFHRIAPGQSLSVANLEMVSLSAVDATLRHHILINPTQTALDLDCPDGNGSPYCAQYVRFTDNQSVTWPHTVPPHKSEIVYTRDSSLVDGDGDSIPDSQDSCGATAALQAVNGLGCGLGQN